MTHRYVFQRIRLILLSNSLKTTIRLIFTHKFIPLTLKLHPEFQKNPSCVGQKTCERCSQSININSETGKWIVDNVKSLKYIFQNTHKEDYYLLFEV